MAMTAAMMNRTLSAIPVASRLVMKRNEVAHDANHCRGCDTVEPHTRNGCTMPNPDEIVRDTVGGESPKPTLTDVAKKKRFSVSPKGAGFKITRTKDSEYTVSHLLGPGGGAGAPRNLYVGDLN